MEFICKHTDVVTDCTVSEGFDLGVYVELVVNNFTLLSWKSFFDRGALGLFFTDDDLIITENAKYDESDEDEEPYTEYKYSTTVKKAVQRLDSIGYTMKKVQTEFEFSVFECLDYVSLLTHLGIDFDKYDEIKEERIRKYVTFKKWKNAVNKYVDYEIQNGSLSCYSPADNPQRAKPRNECEKLVYNSKTNAAAESFYGCLYQKFDPINTIRLILENFQDDNELYIDITEMVGWTYESIEEMRLGDPTEKIIVLVEGTSDKSILEFALKHIYPHLYNLYYFMDFEYARGKSRPGGIDAIASNMKAFVASRIKTRFIAIFDNDTIGSQAKKRLCYEINPMPENCRVLTYPETKLAKRYPTIAVNGKIVCDNINERACSIELYLPDFVIKENGEYLPVEWGSRVQCNIGREKHTGYQGVISDKDVVKERCFNYMSSVEAGDEKFCLEDWLNMKDLIDTILHAFE